MDRILEKQFLANIKGSYMMLKKKIFGPRLKTIFIPRSPRTTRKNRTSPHNGPIKKFFLLNLNILT
jgi:hypothetical protein